MTQALGLWHRVLLAPMAVAAGGRLAPAVSRVRGLALIGGGYGGRAWIDTQFKLAGDEVVGGGLITWALARSPEVLDAALVRRPRALMLAFGDPRPFVSCGIADGRGLAAAIALGADGVLVGSRLRASREAAVSDAMHGATGDGTVRTSVMDVARGLGRAARFTARVPRNHFTETWHGREDTQRRAGQDVPRGWTEGWAGGDPDRANIIVGEAVSLIDAIEPGPAW
jgi:nitronate monooxygenase